MYLIVMFFPVSHYVKSDIGVKAYSLTPFLLEITDISFTN